MRYILLISQQVLDGYQRLNRQVVRHLGMKFIFNCDLILNYL